MSEVPLVVATDEIEHPAEKKGAHVHGVHREPVSVTYTDADGIVHSVELEEIGKQGSFYQVYYKKTCAPLMNPVPLIAREAQTLLKPGVVTCLKCLALRSS